MSGSNEYTGKLQTSGDNCGGEGIHQNIKDICESEMIYPNENGEIKFTLAKKQGSYAALNALKMEEYTNVK